MEKYIYDERNGIHYELVGDYYLPCLTAPELPVLGIWGRRRLKHLQDHHRPIYTGMLLSDTLWRRSTASPTSGTPCWCSS